MFRYLFLALMKFKLTDQEFKALYSTKHAVRSGKLGK